MGKKTFSIGRYIVVLARVEYLECGYEEDAEDGCGYYINIWFIGDGYPLVVCRADNKDYRNKKRDALAQALEDG